MKKSKLSLILSFFMLFNSVTVVANASEKEGKFIPSGNIAAGDYVVINNESYKSSGNTGSLDMKDAQNILKSVENKGMEKIDLNIDKVPEGIKNKKNISNLYKNIEAKEFSAGDKRNYWVSNIQTGTDYQITATLMYLGSKVEVWVADSKISKENATKIGQEYDSKIGPIMENSFSTPSDVDNNGKVNLLLYDIQDGFDGTGGYVAGYFYGVDLYPESLAIQYGLHSNESEMLYIDTYPSMYYEDSTVYPEEAYETIAHEMQHLVNFGRNVLVEGGETMPVWINEGLSEAAGQIYSGKPSYSRIDYYNKSTAITNGYPLMDWNDYDVLSNYSLSYLFFQYLKVQANKGDIIFKEILMDTENSEIAIEKVIKKYIGNMTIGEFTTAFRMALLMKDKTGLYGFKGDEAFDKLQKKIFLGNPSNGVLYGGGAVVIPGGVNKALNIPGDKDINIKYFGNYDRFNRVDINKDFKIDILDISVLASSYDTETTKENWYIDPNRDGLFDLFDLVLVSRNIK